MPVHGWLLWGTFVLLCFLHHLDRFGQVVTWPFWPLLSLAWHFSFAHSYWSYQHSQPVDTLTRTVFISIANVLLPFFSFNCPTFWYACIWEKQEIVWLACLPHGFCCCQKQVWHEFEVKVAVHCMPGRCTFDKIYLLSILTKVHVWSS